MTSQQKITEFTSNNPENDDTTGDISTDETGSETFEEYIGLDSDSAYTESSDDSRDSGDQSNETTSETHPASHTIDTEHEYRTDHDVGAPDGWVAAGDDPTIGPDYRCPEQGRPPEPGETPDYSDVFIPVRKVSAIGVTTQQLEKYGITKDEARFLRAVVKGMNRTLEGYDLIDSMIDIVSHYDVNEEKLVENGYLKRHTGACRRRYFTVTHDGQEACGITKEHGREIGDLGADTMHRVGIDLARNYYENKDHIRFAELSARENGNETDLIVVDMDGNRDTIIEVEAGRVSADPDVTEDQPAGTHNYGSIRKDYGILAESDGDAVWVVRNAEVAGTVLRALNSSDDVPVDLPKDIIERVENTKLKIPTLNEKHLDPMDADGIDEIVTFKQLRIRLR